MSNIHSRRTPFGQQSRRYRKSVYIETKNQIRRHAPILGGLFTTHHYMHDKLSWIDGYFLSHKAPIFYNFTLETTRNAYKELICDQAYAGVKTFASSPIIPTPATADNSTAAASTAFVKAQNYLVTGSTTSAVPEGSNLYYTNGRASAAAPVQTVAGRNGNVVLAVADVAGAAPLASPVLTGVPTTPTAGAGNNSTQAASTAFVQAAITAVIGAAPAALDTLVEIATALGNDASIASTLTTSIATKLTKASNLSDLTDIAAARSNLALGSMALQNSNAVAISGGTIDNITFDSGTF